MDVKNLEHPTLKVPYEILNKRFRSSQKILDREVSHVSSAVSDLEKLAKRSSHGSGNSELVRQVDTALSVVQERLEQLRSKSNEAMDEELESVEICSKRVKHLKEGCSDPPSDLWRKTRLDRMLVEYFLRSGFYDTAMKLAQNGDIESLTNINLFLVAKEVEEALSVKDVSKCLLWCHDNKSKLRKMKSTLEFDMRLQEFIELVKKDKKIEAIKHAKKFLATEDAEQLPTVQQGMALLAFPLDTQIQPYCDMLQETRWKELIEQFRTENYRLYQLSNQSVFTVALQVGLSALKTPMCNRPQKERNAECPVCQPSLNNLAQKLPNAHCSHSRLICHVTGIPLNENNHPLMLPNGYVYGEQALMKMATENDGQIICPRTKEVFSIRDCEKVYVM